MGCGASTPAKDVSPASGSAPAAAAFVDEAEGLSKIELTADQKAALKKGAYAKLSAQEGKTIAEIKAIAKADPEGEGKRLLNEKNVIAVRVLFLSNRLDHADSQAYTHHHLIW